MASSNLALTLKANAYFTDLIGYKLPRILSTLGIPYDKESLDGVIESHAENFLYFVDEYLESRFIDEEDTVDGLLDKFAEDRDLGKLFYDIIMDFYLARIIIRDLIDSFKISEEE